jgi:hypothetical protein
MRVEHASAVYSRPSPYTPKKKKSLLLYGFDELTANGSDWTGPSTRDFCFFSLG